MGMEETGKELSLEEIFESLDAAIEQLQSKELSLEQAFSAYRKGMELVKAASARIDLVEKQVQVLDAEGNTDAF